MTGENKREKKDSILSRALPGGISARLKLSLLLVFVLLVSGFGTVYYFESARKTDNVVIDVAGRNRMLSQKIAYYAELVFSGKKEFVDLLKQSVQLHDKSLKALKEGGEVYGFENQRFIKKAPESSEKYFQKIDSLWKFYRKDALLIAEKSKYFDLKSDPDAKEALRNLENKSKELLQANQELVTYFVKQADTKQAFLTKLLFIILFFGFLIILLIAYIIFRIIKSIRYLQKGVEIISSGNLSYRTSLAGGDEISKLSKAFDEMTEKLLQAQKEKMQILERSKKDLEKRVEEKTLSLRKAQDAILDVLVDVRKEKEKIFKSKAQDEAVFSSIAEGLIILDSKNKITFANSLAEKLLGYKKGELEGRLIDEVFQLYFLNNPEKAGPKIMSLMDKANQKFFLKRKNGTLFPSLIKVSKVILNKKTIGSTLLFADISKDFSVDKAKSEFVSLASHQLRTPLSGINWFVEMLLSESVGALNEKQKVYLQEIYGSSKRMTELVNSLLNVSRIELGTLAVNPEPTDLELLIKEILNEYKLEIKKKSLLVESLFDKVPKIPLDKKIFKVAMENLISNAVKYTPAGGKIGIVLENEKESVLIKVSDNGYGIPKEQQKRIFQKLFRADNVVKMDTKGTGLGLYITKSIVEQSGGEIWFDSPTYSKKLDDGTIKKGGTTFYCKIPKKGMEKKEGSRYLS